MTARAASAFLTTLLGVLIAPTALGMDMFLPSVPAISQAFGSEPGAAQLVITTYLLGLATGQFAWGPLADRFGRKPVLMAALALFFASSVASPVSMSKGRTVPL